MSLSKHGIIYILAGFAILALMGVFYNFSVIGTIGDETVLMSATLKMISEKTLRPAYPTNYHMPFGTYIYLPFFIFTLAFLRLSGLFSSFDELKEFGILEYPKLLPVARFISAVLAIISIYLVYRICQKLFNNAFISLVASFLLATNMTFLVLAHFGKVWMPQIFVILLAFYFITDFYKKDEPKLKDYIVPAFLTGVSFGTHFIGVLVYLPFLAAHYFKNINKRFYEIFLANKNLWLANLVLVLVMLAVFYLNPYGFINYASWSTSATADVLNQGTNLEGGKFDLWRGISAYAVFLFDYGHALTLIFLASLIPLFLRRRDLFFILMSFIAGYYFVIGPLIASSARPAPVYAGPLIPFMAIIAAYGIHEFYQSGFISKKIKITAIFAVLIFSLYLPIMLDYAILRPSSVVEADSWIRNNIPSGSKIVNIGLTLPFNENRESIGDIKKYNPEFLTKRQNYMLFMDEENYPTPNYYVLDTGIYKDGVPQEILNTDFDYVVISWHSGGYDSALNKAKSYGIQEKNLLRTFPSDATPDGFSDNIEAIRKPLFNLRKVTHNGPAVAIYALTR